MHGRGTATEFDITNAESSGANGCAAEEGKVQRYGMWLITNCVGGGEVESNGGEEA